MLIREAVKIWMEWKQADWQPDQQERVTYIVKHWLHRWGDKAVAAVDAVAVEELETERLRAGRKPTTLNAEKVQLKAFFKYAMRHGWTAIKDNPAEVWRTRERVIDEEYYCTLSEEEEAKLLQVVSPQWRRLILGALGTGLRASALRRLRWEWFRQEPEGWFLTIPAKAMKMKRELAVPVTDKVMEAIGPAQKEGLVFSAMPERVNLAHRFKMLVYRTSCNPRLKFHDLRATFATRLLDRGVPLTTVMRLGGWKKPDVVLDRYMRKLEAKTAREALNRL